VAARMRGCMLCGSDAEREKARERKEVIALQILTGSMTDEVYAPSFVCVSRILLREGRGVWARILGELWSITLNVLLESALMLVNTTPDFDLNISPCRRFPLSESAIRSATLFASITSSNFFFNRVHTFLKHQMIHSKSSSESETRW
jgi:hypothetical protein